MSDQAFLFVVLCALAIIFITILTKCGLLKLGQVTFDPKSKLALMTPLGGFLLFLASLAFVPLWTAKLIQYTDTHGLSSFSKLEKINFCQLVGLIVSAFLLMGFSRIHSEAVRARIWGEKSPLKPFLKGILYCILTYPIVMTLVQGIHLGVEWSGFKHFHEQVALSQLEAIRSFPWLFWTFAVAVITLVPLVEEFLFRGLCQNYLLGFLGPKFAIFFTSLLFAFFHYSSEQGPSNFELLIGLFLYSYFMGIFYLKERSLWTSIAMHASFNAITLFFMFLI